MNLRAVAGGRKIETGVIVTEPTGVFGITAVLIYIRLALDCALPQPSVNFVHVLTRNAIFGTYYRRRSQRFSHSALVKYPRRHSLIFDVHY